MVKIYRGFRQTEGNEERLGGGKPPGGCSLGFVLNGFILFFNNLEEAQQRVFMVCAVLRIDPSGWVGKAGAPTISTGCDCIINLFNKFSKDVLVRQRTDASL